jgi:hypothetical protein
MTTDTKRTALPALRTTTTEDRGASRLLQRIEDAALFCAFAMALSLMATSAVMVVSA